MENERSFGISVNEEDLKLFSLYKNNSFYDYIEIFEKTRRQKRQQYGEDAIKKILSNNDYYEQLVDILYNTKRIKINVNKIKDIKLAINRTIFVDICNQMYKQHKLDDVKNIKEKMERLNYSTSSARVVEEFPEYVVNINGNDTKYNTQHFFEFLNKAEHVPVLLEEMKYGVRNKHFIYALKRFMLDNKIYNDVSFSEKQKEILLDVFNDRVADTYALSEINETKDIIEPVALHPELIKYVNGNMPESYTKLKKALYTYIKLCRMSTYDPEFYAERQTVLSNQIKLDKSRISEITPTNNRVVCYEINQIYAQLLKDLKINYEVDSILGGYGTGHTNLTFKVQDFVVQADTVSTILGSDLLNSKLHYPLKGLVCKNPSKEVQQRFQRILNDVYEDIKQNEPSPYVENNSFDTWGELLTVFIEDPLDITMKQKIELFTEVAARNTLPLTEKIAYLTRTYNNMFGKERMTYMTIVGQKKEGETWKKPTLIITYNDHHEITKIVHNKYVLLDEGKWKELPRARLQELFDEKKLSYISDHVVPGIKAPTAEDIKE